MATLTPTLTLTSSDTTSDALSLTVTDSLTTTVPNIDSTRVSVDTSGTALIASSISTINYVYIKNADSTQVVVLETVSGTQAFSDLQPGEFVFLPLKGSIGIKAKSAASTATIEYGYWTKG
mgnify:CR=1 FL=1|tara:strand:- start:94 stop:456 length:363 start_codon:yes stop_codon:yes gene_type:complete